MIVLLIIAIVIAALFVLSLLIYWFNLDTKLVKLLEKPMNRHYDKIKRDKRL
jgi:hypothetical protein